MGATIGEAKNLPPGEIIEKLYAAVTGFVGEVEQADDLTAVVLKRSANGR